MEKNKNQATKLMSFKNQLLNYGLIIVILGLTLYFLFTNINSIAGNGEINFSEIDFGSINYLWLLPALACIVISVGSESVNLHLLCRKIGYPRSFKQTSVFAASDIYFSAITPSATGGQPAAAYYMVKSGVPVSLSSAVLLLNVTLYTVGLLFISLFAFILKPEFFMDFTGMEKFCFILGFALHAILIVFCLFCMFSRKLVYFLGDFTFTILAKLHLIKNKDERIASYRAAVSTYQEALTIVLKHKWMIPVLLFNGILQRVILAPITYFVFLALSPLGIPAFSFLDVFTMQLYCIVGASALPLPGGAGIAETLFVSMFSGHASSSVCMLSMLFSRGISSYLSVLVCGTMTITHHVRMKKAEYERLKHEELFHTTNESNVEEVPQ